MFKALYYWKTVGVSENVMFCDPKILYYYYPNDDSTPDGPGQ